MEIMGFEPLNSPVKTAYLLRFPISFKHFVQTRHKKRGPGCSGASLKMRELYHIGFSAVRRLSGYKAIATIIIDVVPFTAVGGVHFVAYTDLCTRVKRAK